MTTAGTRDNRVEPVLDASFAKATPFSYGAGHIRPDRTMNPGLMYDLMANDYLDFLFVRGYNESKLRLFTKETHSCQTVDLNYPLYHCPGSQCHRGGHKVKNVGTPGTYSATVKTPTGVSVSIQPRSLVFKKRKEEKEFKVVLKPNVAGKPADYVFGMLIWSDGVHYASSLVVKRQ